MELFSTKGLKPEIVKMVKNDVLFQKMPSSLLGESNAKTIKGEKVGVLTGILYLAPANTIGAKFNLCPYAGVAGCKTGCLNTAGRGAFDSVQKARIRKTLMYFQYHDQFMATLARDIERLQRKATKQGKTLAVRLNGTSDIQWEKEHFFYNGKKTIFDVFPRVQFYDYTKIPRRTVPSNYHLTFSYSGVTEYARVVDKQLRHDSSVNLAVVFSGKLPTHFMNREVINGDENDVRFYDPTSVIVGLTAKGKAKTDTSNFVVAGV